MSPFSIVSVMAIILQGAEGRTFKKIRKILGVSGDKEAIGKQFREYFEKIGIKENCVKPLLIANGLYIQDGYEFDSMFFDAIINKFNFDITQLNFAPKMGVGGTMVKTKTNNRINERIPAESFNKATRLVGINTIYLRNDWKHQFKKEQTFTGMFYLNQKRIAPIEFMQINDTFRYANIKELKASVLELDYNNSDLTFVIVLPESRTGLSALEKKLKNIDYQKIAKALCTTEVNVVLPKFKMEFELSLRNALKKVLRLLFLSNNKNHFDIKRRHFVSIDWAESFIYE